MERHERDKAELPHAEGVDVCVCICIFAVYMYMRGVMLCS